MKKITATPTLTIPNSMTAPTTKVRRRSASSSALGVLLSGIFSIDYLVFGSLGQFFHYTPDQSEWFWRRQAGPVKCNLATTLASLRQDLAPNR